MVRSRDGAAVPVEKRAKTKPRYGYIEAHRQLEPEQADPSCLSDREWNLVDDLYEQTGTRGTPPQYERRMMLDACCYVVRTGGSWRMLPREFSP